MMKLPEAIPIGSQLYEVLVVEKFPDDGACDRSSSKTIWIEDVPDNPRALLLNFWHEVIHAGEREYGYMLKDKMYDSDVDRIAQCVTQAMLALVEAA